MGSSQCHLLEGAMRAEEKNICVNQLAKQMCTDPYYRFTQIPENRFVVLAAVQLDIVQSLCSSDSSWQQTPSTSGYFGNRGIRDDFVGQKKATIVSYLSNDVF